MTILPTTSRRNRIYCTTSSGNVKSSAANGQNDIASWNDEENVVKNVIIALIIMQEKLAIVKYASFSNDRQGCLDCQPSQMVLQPFINRPRGAWERLIGVVINDDGRCFLKFAVTHTKRIGN